MNTTMQEVHDMADFVYRPKIHVRIREHGDTITSAMEKRIEGFKKRMLSDDIKKAAADIYRDCVDYYVPKETGDLRSFVEYRKYNGDYAIHYLSKYARAQYNGYNGKGVIRNYTTPNTYDHWNKHMTRSDRDTCYDLIAEMILEKTKAKV